MRKDRYTIKRVSNKRWLYQFEVWRNGQPFTVHATLAGANAACAKYKSEDALRDYLHSHK